MVKFLSTAFVFVATAAAALAGPNIEKRQCQTTLNTALVSTYNFSLEKKLRKRYRLSLRHFRRTTTTLPLGSIMVAPSGLTLSVNSFVIFVAQSD
jgi:hypothetical protein